MKNSFINLCRGNKFKTHFEEHCRVRTSPGQRYQFDYYYTQNTEIIIKK